ncbi:YdbC family protein [Polycladomyces subterraneus]|uniref:YdbC family protein n=1 Tax=Polycladomyces subterraneus TaxID=1016997 RepID=A0ABT8ILN7_9BACL|nr:YdbC family protein [Polycladomyces subterraneus]MDN4593666.1 YdbC family protein [Polycladomyces subterraneus]
MLIKWIVCNVPEEKREAFSLAQQQWSALRDVPGFVAQFGGWNAVNPAEACIVGLWKDRDSYTAFMEKIHDEIYISRGQQETFDRIAVTVMEMMLPVGHLEGLLSGGWMKAELIRIADCWVLPGREAHFLQMQQEVWNPAMEQTDGMLGGVFAGDMSARRFLTITWWKSAELHRAYVKNHVANLREQADLDLDIERIVGYEVRCEPSWRVTATVQSDKGR